MTTTTVPVERWLKYFSHFKDHEILKEEYALTRDTRGRPYCKLCDCIFTGPGEEHIAQHAREVAEYRDTRKAAADEKRRETLELTRAERAASQTREPRQSGLTPERQAYNRITSTRSKLNHPPKGREWNDREKAEIHESLEAAIAAHAAIKKEAK